MTQVNSNRCTEPEGCPGQSVLTAITLGKLPVEEIERLGRHLEVCGTCQRLLEGLDAVEDSVIADIKGQAGLPPPNPELEEQIRQAEAISRVAWRDESQVNAIDQPPPIRVRQYQVLGRIGQGGMGAVYKARHPHLKRDVAIKLLPMSRLGSPDSVLRFQREMEAVGRLDHPNLVRAHDAGEANGQHFLVMEFLDGTDLSKLVRAHGPLSVANACEIIHRAAQGLQYAHTQGLIHRDVKPSNLFLTRDGTVKVLDLGLAKFADEVATAGESTGCGQIVGTGDFISPEQGQDTRGADARSDIYSLGCTLYYLLAGKAPFSDANHGTFIQKVMGHAHEPVPPIQAVRNDIPDRLAQFLGQMLAKDPAQRFQTAVEVAEAMRNVAGSRDLRGVVERNPIAHRPTKPTVPLATRRWTLISLALVAIVLAIGGWYIGQAATGRGHASGSAKTEPLTMEKAEEIGRKIVRDMEPDLRKLEQAFPGMRLTTKEKAEATKRTPPKLPAQAPNLP